MNIDIICVGKIKEGFFREALAEYAKRLSKYCKLSIIEVADEQTPDGCSDKEAAIIMQKEGDRIISKITSDAYIIATAIEGKSLSSEQFARLIEDKAISGVNHLAFIIGGSLGLSDEVKAMADMLLSFSAVTFPHQLMRVILTEQVYRAFRIIKGEPYHK
ncbi:MAG: 23S rRNA (pseudouridine(1915)-N(3))-methyltransferase RlmH [Lachnospiraceae bacterium]|nr:23S rRNA (pseudouridine(1915)-N(3))-methyltransferase RlmH [Lachnospiraceae bacterium]